MTLDILNIIMSRLLFMGALGVLVYLTKIIIYDGE